MLVFSSLELEWSTGPGSWRLARPSAHPSRKGESTYCRERGLAKCQDDLQRGASCLLQRGCDGAKCLSGRKRFVLVDTLGCFLDVVVVAAKVAERAGATVLFERLAGQEVALLLQRVWADGGFEGQAWQKQMQARFGFCVEIVKRRDEAKGFELLPKRWVVERSFGWMNGYRRLSKDYEGHLFLARATLLWAMTHKMLQTLKPKPKQHPFAYRSL